MQFGNTSTTRRIAVIQQHLSPGYNGPLDINPTCGIVAFVGGPEEHAVRYLLEGLKILEPRGYDSAGVTTVDQNEKQLVTTKFASLETTSDAISTLAKHTKSHMGHHIGIAHTRWATHGARTNENAHPHHDCEDRIAVCHNGVIENSNVLKKELQAKGITFRSQTDTEVVSQLIGLYVREGMELIDAVIKAQSRLEGTWGLVVIDKENPDHIVASKNGSPLLIGIGEGCMFVGSESGAFSRYTKEFISLEDGETVLLTSTSHSIDRIRVEKLSHSEPILLSPEPFPHWTIKEIMEQPEAIARALNYGGRLIDPGLVRLGGMDANYERLSTVHHLIIAACGTSYYSGLAGAQFMRYLDSFRTVQVVDAAELTSHHIPPEGAGLLLISQSGETKDVHRALTLGQEKGIPCFSVINAVGSLIAREAECGVYLNAGRENGVASTKAFTCQVTVLCLIAIWFSSLLPHTVMKRKALVDALHRLPTNVGMTLNGIRGKCQNIANKIHDAKVEHIFVLGKGSALPIALEGALKIKEISYIHAEGYPGAALKHGPYALIEEGTPIILIILNNEHASKMKIVAEEVRGRGASLIIITDSGSLFKDDEFASSDKVDIVVVPSNGMLSNVIAVLPLQMLAYELSLLKGIDPDRPRHLAKCVTVD